MPSQSALNDRINQLEREARRVKGFLWLIVFSFLTIGATAAQEQRPTRLVTNSIEFRRPNGLLVAELRVEDGADPDITLRDSKGVVRLSLGGLTGINLPPYTSLGVHDPVGHQKASIVAEERRVAAGLAGSEPKELSFDFRSATRATLEVKNDEGTLTFFDALSKRVLSIPNR